MSKIEYVDNGLTYFDEAFNRLFKDGHITEDQLNSAADSLFENTEQLVQAKNFIKTHKSDSELPVVGNNYVPVSITMYGHYDRLEIKTSQIPIQLISIPGDYVFRVNSIIHKFPREAKASASIGETFLYQSTQDALNMVQLILLSLQFPRWNIAILTVLPNGELYES